MNGEFFYENVHFRFMVRRWTYLGDGEYAYYSDYDGKLTQLVNFNNISNWCIEKQLEWYEYIPEQGILCYVTDSESDLIKNTRIQQVAFIKKYNEGMAYPFRNEYEFGWRFAIPVSSLDDVLLENIK